MATTANGTAYTVHAASVSGAGTVYWAIDDTKAAEADLPFVLYMHGAGGAANDFQGSKWVLLRDWLIDNGFGFIEGAGGGLQPWGNPASEAAYANSFDHVDALFDIAYVVVLGRSMGGAVADRLYNARRGGDARWVGLVNNSGVQDLVWAYDYDSGRWTAAFNSAWSVANKTAFVAAVAGLNPIDGPASAWDGAHVLQLIGDADDTVPPAANGLAMRTMYAGHPALDQLDVRAGGDHSTSNGSYLQVAAMSAFLLEVTGQTPPPPAPSDSYTRIRRYIVTGGRKRILTPRRP